MHLCLSLSLFWKLLRLKKEKAENCFRIDNVAEMPENKSRNPENISAKYQHNLADKSS